MISDARSDRFGSPVPRPRRHRAARRGTLYGAGYAGRRTDGGSPRGASSSPPAAAADVPPIPVWTGPHLTNATLFDLAERPDHLMIWVVARSAWRWPTPSAELGDRVSGDRGGHDRRDRDPELVAGLRDALPRAVTMLEGDDRHCGEPGPVLVLADGRASPAADLLVAAGRTPKTLMHSIPVRQCTESGQPAPSPTTGCLRSDSNQSRHVTVPRGDIADPQGIGPRAFTHVGALSCRHRHPAAALFRLPAADRYAASWHVSPTPDPELAQVGAKPRQRAPPLDRSRAPFCARRCRTTTGDRRRDPRRGLLKFVVSGDRVIARRDPRAESGEMIGVGAGAGHRQHVKLSRNGVAVIPYPTPLGGQQNVPQQLVSARRSS